MKNCILLLIVILVTTIPMSHAEDKTCSDEKMNNVEILQCLMHEYEELEEKRQTAEKNWIKSAEELDQLAGYENSLEATRKSKEAFEIYREIECRRYRLTYGNGSLAGHGEVECKIKLTKQRIDIL